MFGKCQTRLSLRLISEWNDNWFTGMFKEIAVRVQLTATNSINPAGYSTEGESKIAIFFKLRVNK